MSHGVWQFLAIWFVLIVVLLVVLGAYYGARAARGRRGAQQASRTPVEPSVPRPAEPHVAESRPHAPEPVAAHADAGFAGDFTIDPNAVKGDAELFGRQGEVRDVPLEIEEIETSRGAQLRTLDGLRAQGFITDEEYEQRRTAILGK